MPLLISLQCPPVLARPQPSIQPAPKPGNSAGEKGNGSPMPFLTHPLGGPHCWLAAYPSFTRIITSHFLLKPPVPPFFSSLSGDEPAYFPETIELLKKKITNASFQVAVPGRLHCLPPLLWIELSTPHGNPNLHWNASLLTSCNGPSRSCLTKASSLRDHAHQHTNMVKYIQSKTKNRNKNLP